jgi:hypothetical protein
MAKTANAYLKIIVVSDMKRAVNDFTSAHPKIAAFARGIAKAGLIAGAAIGALVATFYLLKKALMATLGAYVNYGKQLIGLTRISGITGTAVQNLSAQFRMSGVDSAKAQTSLGLFAKKLDAARQGTAAAIVPFKRLGVHLRESDGSLRKTGDVLAEVRDKLSDVKDASTRAGIAAALFGRGFQTLGAWITKSKEDIAAYNKIVAESGVTWGGKQVRGMKDFIQAQREMGLRWDLFRVNLGQNIMPVANKFTRSMSKWMGDAKNQKAVEDLAQSLGTIAVAMGEIAAKTGIVNDRFAKFGQFGEMIKGFVLPFSGLATILKGPGGGKTDPIAETEKRLAKLRSNLAKRLSVGYFDNKKLLARIAATQEKLNTLRAKTAAPMNLHVNTAEVTSAFGRVSSAYELMRSYIANRPISMHVNTIRSTSMAKGHALGGIVSRPTFAMVGESGPEAIIPLTRPARARQVMQQAGLAGAGGYGTINVNVVVPGGTTLIGTAREVGEIIAPHVARALGREAARTGRRR